MKKYEVHVLKKATIFGNAKDKLSKEVEEFLNRKSSAGYEVVNVSFTYYQTMELVAFVTICK